MYQAPNFKQEKNTDLLSTPGAEEDEALFDVAIVGGGLSGLSLSILLAKSGHKVLLLEKERYPFHKVCGEYISLESWNFLDSLGYPLSDLDLPIIKHLTISAPNGNSVSHDLPLGGFGISRYKIDSEMAAIARQNGVLLLEGTKVSDVNFHETEFSVRCTNTIYRAKVVCGAFGKRSNLDVKWKRLFAGQRPNKLNNYIGVKYHIESPNPADSIALHNFQDGYCGISKIEENKSCLCYLTTAANLRACSNSITRLEETVLQKNPLLKKVFEESKLLYTAPLTISQISFEEKSQVENHILMIGDAAGMITPLCGNGMSMAMHAAKIAAELVTQFLSRRFTRQQLEDEYIQQWRACFGKRLKAGRMIQRFFGSEWVTNKFIFAVKPFPRLISYLIRQTHGEPF
ncbi:MAG: NAD(P)/FAD-dependent oxidoreductase [Chitinophagaceae bacterium]